MLFCQSDGIFMFSTALLTSEWIPKSVSLFPQCVFGHGNVVTLSSNVITSLTVMSSSPQSWLRRVVNSLSISLSSQVMLASEIF